MLVVTVVLTAISASTLARTAAQTECYVTHEDETPDKRQVVVKDDTSSSYCSSSKWCYKINFINAQYTDNDGELVDRNGWEKGCIKSAKGVHMCESIRNMTLRGAHCKYWEEYKGHSVTKGMMYVCCCDDQNLCNHDVVPPKRTTAAPDSASHSVAHRFLLLLSLVLLSYVFRSCGV